jgi:hypothetical protein
MVWMECTGVPGALGVTAKRPASLGGWRVDDADSTDILRDSGCTEQTDGLGLWMRAQDMNSYFIRDRELWLSGDITRGVHTRLADDAGGVREADETRDETVRLIAQQRGHLATTPIP